MPKATRETISKRIIRISSSLALCCYVRWAERDASQKAAGLRLFDYVRKLLRPAEGGAEVLLRLCPVLAGAGGDARNRLEKAHVPTAQKGAHLHRLLHQWVELGC